MNIARTGMKGMLTPLQEFWRWVAPSSQNGHTENEFMGVPSYQNINHQISKTTRSDNDASEIIRSHATRKPLRTVRILEENQPKSTVGRMVMSGSMADICAELDRLAARECVLH